MSDQSNAEVKAPETPVPQAYQQGAGIYFVPVPNTQPVNYPLLQGLPQGQAVSQPVPQQKFYYQNTNQYVHLNEQPQTPVAPPTASNDCCNNTSVNNSIPQNGCENKWRWGGGCRRRCGNGQQGGCHWEASNRPLGTVTEFFWSMIFSTVLPIFAPLTVYAFETSQLARLGSLYGTADFLFAVAIAIFHVAHVGQHHYSIWIVASLTLLLSLILFIAACKRFWFHLWQYQQVVANNKAAAEPVVSEVGKRCELVVSFLISFFLPVIGTFARIRCRSSLQSRFGAMKGLAWLFIIAGAVFGVFPALIGGLFLLQVSKVHFQRAIISASASSVSNAV